MRKALMGICHAQKAFGVDATTFIQPEYVKDGHCRWCGKETPKRKKYCDEECRDRFYGWVVWERGRGSYSTQILRRDNFACRVCGEFHAAKNEHGIYIPASDGQLAVHHIQYVSNGGTDHPDNLLTVCKRCHKQIHAHDKEANHA